jgi:hypothetical protein
MTSCSSRRCLPSHPRPPPLVSTLPSHTPNPTHRCVLELPGTFLSGESPLADRNPSKKHPRGKGIGIPCYGPMGQKALVGRAASAGWSCSTVGRAQLNSALFLFPFELFQIHFKSSLNFRKIVGIRINSIKL